MQRDEFGNTVISSWNWYIETRIVFIIVMPWIWFGLVVGAMSMFDYLSHWSYTGITLNSQDIGKIIVVWAYLSIVAALAWILQRSHS